MSEKQRIIIIVHKQASFTNMSFSVLLFIFKNTSIKALVLYTNRTHRRRKEFSNTRL